MTPLYSDADLAALLKMSRSWVRKQRMLRRAGLPHVLTVDPVMIGKCPRYRRAEIETWLAHESAQQDAQRPKGIL